MQAIITCSSCQSRLTLPAAVAGNTVQCPRCGVVFTALPPPADETLATPPLAPPDPALASAAPASGNIQPAGGTGPPANDRRDLDEPDVFDGDEMPAELPGRLRAVVALAALGFSILGAFAVAGVAVVALDVADPYTTVLANRAAVTTSAVADKYTTCRFLIDNLLRINLVVALASGICFLIWFSGAHDNLKYLGASNLDYTPGWAVAAFFIPILNLFRPFQVAQEIYRASSPDVSRDRQGNWRGATTSTLINWWWAMCLIRLLAGGCGNGFASFQRRPTLLSADYLHAIIFSGILTMVVAALTMAMIKQMYDRQTQRFEKALVALARRAS